MLNLQEAASLARKRVSERLEAAKKNENAPILRSAAIIERRTSFRAHLIHALRRSGDERTSPSPAPEALFLAFPEKLLGKWYQLAYGPQRQSKEPSQIPSRDEAAWQTWDSVSRNTKITNFATTEPTAVLLAHGLSAIEDSVLLLADIGRASRAARAIGVRLCVLLADVTWISYNRSLKSFELTDRQIEDGLVLCLDSRKRLYEAIGAEVKVYAIVPYQRKGTISGKKISMIANHYMNLASNLWGAEKINTAEPLDNPTVQLIGKRLEASLSADSPLTFLAGFPGAIPALEAALSHHLSVLRTIVQRFRLSSVRVFLRSR